MILIDLDLQTTDSQQRACRYIIEQFVNGAWHQKEAIDVASATPQARRRFLLEQNERLVVEELVSEVAIWDHEQMATKMVPRVVLLPKAAEETQFSVERVGDIHVAKTK